MAYYKTNNKENFFKSKADYFKGVARMRRLTACVHLEGDTDKHFWKNVFKEHFPDGKFFFLSYSKLQDRRRISGVEHCLKYVPYLNGQFFICIDSDYRYLTRKRYFEISDYVFQTYTYSIENHYCFVENLNKVCSLSGGLENNIFDFDKFLSDYSKIVYELFIWHLFLLDTGNHGMTNFKFNEILTNFPRLSVEGNGELMLSSLRDRVEKKLDKLRDLYSDIDISKEFARYSELGVKRHNTYLFLRGHNIYDFIIKLGKMCSRRLREDYKDISNKSDEKLDIHFKSLPSFERVLMNSLFELHYQQREMIANDVEYFKKYLSSVR